MAFATIAGRRIEYRMIPAQGAAQPPLVFLHEGLGSMALWRDFPDQVAARIGARALVYSRLGYGQSDALLTRRTARFMHDEALQSLPPLFDALGIERPLLVGHSDGASIALIYAASAGRPVHGLALIAPHVFVEAVCLENIAKIRETYHRGDLKSRLAKHHAHVEDAFLGWADTWLDPVFMSWSIESLIAHVEAPMLLIQGLKDEYGTLVQLDRIQALAKAATTRVLLADCGHSPHREEEAAVIDLIATFAAGLAGRSAPTSHSSQGER
jgi:pimeloyl-ACP methyl ester carboxylesterase